MMSIYERIAAESGKLFQEAIEIRRTLHKWPEEGFKEFKTSALIADYLKKLGLDEVRTEVAVTGVIGVLKGALPGPTIALRADMDGLPILEKTGLAFASEREGWMHGCGHDGHTAGLLAAAKLLAGLRSELPGTIKFIFQPAEEGPGGALPMTEQGAMDGVDIVLGGHMWGDYKPGQVALVSGPMFASPTDFRISIQGVGGHAAAPHTAIDTVPIMANIIQALQTIVSRKVEPGLPSVLTIGTVRAGYRHNVIADTCVMEGTIRTFDRGVEIMVKKALNDMVPGIASAMGAEAKVEYTRYYPPVINDHEVTEKMTGLAKMMLGDENVKVAKPTMGGEDFAYFLGKVPGTFMFIGSANEGDQYWNDAHHPCFNIDERALVTMMKMYAAAPFWFADRTK